MGFGNEGVSERGAYAHSWRRFRCSILVCRRAFCRGNRSAGLQRPARLGDPAGKLVPALKNAREQADKSPVDKLAAQNAAASGAKALTAGGKSADSDTAAGDEAVDDNAIAVPFFSKPMRIGVQLDFVSYNNGAAYRKTREQLQGVFGDRNVEFVSLNVEQLVNAITDNEVDFLILMRAFTRATKR